MRVLEPGGEVLHLGLCEEEHALVVHVVEVLPLAVFRVLALHVGRRIPAVTRADLGTGHANANALAK